MSKPKIYISKSNVVSYDHLIKLRWELAMLDVEIIEYDGKSSYDPSIVKKADYILILTYDGAKNEDTYLIGKGIYNEIQNFENKKNIYVVNPYPKHTLISKMNKVCEFNVNDWKKEYAIIYTENAEYWLPNLFTVKENIDLKKTVENVEKKDNNYKYLLLTV